MCRVSNALLVSLTLAFAGCSNAPVEDAASEPGEVDSMKLVNETVETSCGQCQFDMEGDGCDLAIRIGKKTFWVDGTGIDDHGDAHGDDGLCNCVRKAIVSGEISDGRFTATSFKLQVEKEKSLN